MVSILVEAALRSLVLGAAVWLAMKLLRVRNPQAGQIVWRLVLVAALLMPLLMQLKMLTLPAPTTGLLSIVRLDGVTPAPSSQFNWQDAVLGVYFCVALVLSVRQLFGFARMRRIHRAAEVVREHLIEGVDIRVSAALRAPVTFGSTILLPSDYGDWNAIKRSAVLEHERMHIANRDFDFQVLAHAHRALFWFSPLAWWLPRQLNLLSEQLSDDAAVRAIGDRASYAEILLSFVTNPRNAATAVAVSMAVPMARPATLVSRVERIVSESELPKQLNLTRRTALAAGLIPLVLGIASCSADKNEQVQQSASSTPPQASGEGAPPVAPDSAVQVPEAPENAIKPKSNKLYPLSSPAYPSKSRRAGQTGTVVMLLHVLEDGSVDDVKIKKSSSFTRLDYAAANEAFNWQLDPGTVEGKPQAMWGQFAVTFKLDD